MPKRKKSGFDDGSDCGKRRKYDLSEQLQELIESLRNYKTSQGKLLCETFMRAPKRRTLAEYYEKVSTPIDLLRIQQKIRMDEYDDLDQFESDIKLLINNTKAFFTPDTTEYADAVKLWDVYVDLKNQIFGSSSSTASSDESSIAAECKNDSADEKSEEADASSIIDSGSVDDEDPFEELFGAIMSAVSDDGRQLSTMFELLPSRAAYPDYYDIVTEPIDLKMIASRIQNHEYNNLNDLEKDLILMIRNAKMYNAPGSQIYKDANALKRTVQQKRSEIETRRTTPAAKSSERIRAKRQNPFGQQNKWSSIAAALKYDEDGQGTSTTADNDDDFEENELNFSDSEHDQDDNKDSNPHWMLYNAVYETPHSEPFFRLPSRRIYPDYYKEIKHPISLGQIGNRIKTNQYERISDLLDDLKLVFDNAMNYNRPDSKIYKNAAKLKKILQMKAREIMSVYKDEGGEDDDDEYDDDDEDGADTAYDDDDNDGGGGDSNLMIPSPTKKSKAGQKPSRSSKRSMVNAMSQELKNVRRSQKAINSQQKSRMITLYRTVLHSDDNGRLLIDPFMEKPSRKLYPDYYDVIERPIDMKTIESKIRNNLYESETALVNDFRLMFSNCRRYNEDGSLIYQDADRLEQIMDSKILELGPSQNQMTNQLDSTGQRMKKERIRPSSAIQLKMKQLFDAVQSYRDIRGRQLSSIFMKLPSRTDFPDYYEVIAKPLCLEKINQRIKNCVYETVEDLLSDIILMLDNACKYNEPDSQIFKDALTLQQVALQTKIGLNVDTVNGIPDVKIIVQDLLTNLFISVYTHQDEEGRCFSDSINELTETNPTELKTLNFDIIKRNLNLGRYRRLDRFQQDMFDVFERSRKVSRTDSQAFEDSIELQSHFIAKRNELCSNGELLSSKALNYTLNTLQIHIENLRQEKVPKELSEEESNRQSMDTDKEIDTVNNTSSMSIGGPMQTINEDETIFYQDLMLKVGDFVYVEPHDKNLDPHIVYIESFKKDNTGQALIYGCWFYRPPETFHLASRKFLEKEVFKSDNFTTTPISQVKGKCCVMFVKDYFRCQPINIDDKDVYVCESRYTSKGKSFKKIKIWPCLQNTPYIMRANLLPMSRVPSVFAKNRQNITTAGGSDGKPVMIETGDEISANDDVMAPVTESTDCSVLDVPRPNVPCPPPIDCPVDPGVQIQFYEQFSIPAGTFRVGDCCYVRTDQERNLICRIDRMWVDHDGNPYFHGPWYVQQAELPPTTIGSFYPQEVFLSSIEDTNPLLSICERCSVLDTKDYCTLRPTEFMEKDVYVCEIRYLEHEKKFEPLPECGLKKFHLQNPATVIDEIFRFRTPLVLTKANHQLPQVIEDPNHPLYQKLIAQQQSHQQGLSSTIDPAQLMVSDSLLSSVQDDSTNDTVTGISITPSTSIMPPPGTPATAAGMTVSNTPMPIGIQMNVTPNGSFRTNNGQILPGTPVTTPIVTPSAIISNNGISTPITSSGNNSKKKPATKRLVTGYIIFASECRRSVVEANPECSFGDISRIIGNQWKLLTPEQKNDFEQRAAKQNAEVKELVAAEKALQESLGPSSPAPQPGQPMENCVFECHWANKCDYQFEDAQDLFEHLTGEPNGHVWISYADTKDKEPGEFQCMFHGCGRVKKGATPFPSIQRLIRHCKEVHINKQIPKFLDPAKRSKNFFPSSKLAAATMDHNSQGSFIQTGQPGTIPKTGTTTTIMQGGQTYQTINIQHQPQLTLGQHQVTTSTIPIMTQQGHQTIVTTPHGTAQLVTTTGQGGQTFISQHPLIATQSGQTFQGVLHHHHPNQSTVVQSVPQSTIQFQANGQQIQLQTTQNAPQSIPTQIHKTSVGVQVKPAEPLFVQPPRTNRLVHSQAYMKYIENLKPDRRFISSWDRQLQAKKPENVYSLARQNHSALSNWLENGPGANHGTIENALWALRNFMHKDALNLAQNC
ncbi:Protein polybromo-1 [Dermatophagoides pteronyssinus]|uniref:Protein polybromo-1 n=1 Tax=Dermatophagoides pteronyssinus TaxID=6956 RepID=A0ABQ8JDH7_DERPT|nr:Protein polybromo-1 [Dermatophagoides pteronyssinus]